MSYDFPDGPDYNPEPDDEPQERQQGEDCPDCPAGRMIVPFGCDTCGLSWQDVLAADGWLRQEAAG
jgi:hypothetical protein